MPMVTTEDLKTFLMEWQKATQITKNSVKWVNGIETIKEHENTSKVSSLKFQKYGNS